MDYWANLKLLDYLLMICGCANENHLQKTHSSKRVGDKMAAEVLCCHGKLKHMGKSSSETLTSAGAEEGLSAEM